MIGTKFNNPLPAEDEAAYSEAAAWANENGAMIVDQGEYYEVVPAPPPPTPTTEQQVAGIKARLNQIDIESVRPLRAIAAGEATADDTEKLAVLASEASALREQLATLTAQAS